MNKLFFNKNFYLFLWKQDRSPFLLILAKFFIFFTTLIIFVFFITKIYTNEKKNLEFEQKKFILIQKKLLSIKNNQALYENNKININEMKINNFLKDINDSGVLNVFKKITNDIEYPLTEYFDIESKQALLQFSEGKALMGARLKFQAKFWHENDFIEFLNKVNRLDNIIREEECFLSRNGKKGNYIQSDIFIKNPEPSLEVKCTIGLYWVS